MVRFEIGCGLQEGIKIGATGVQLSSTKDAEVYIISPQLNYAANKIEISFSVYGKKGTKYSVLLTPNPTYMSQAIPLWENVEVQKSNEWQNLTFNTIVSDLEDKGYAVVVFMPSGVDATMYVDNFTFTKAPNCPKLENLNEIISDSTFTTLDWTEFIVADGYEVMLTKDSLAKADSIVKVSHLYQVDEHPCTITGLDKNTKYDVKVRAICNANDTAAWSNTIAIHTTCGTREEAIFVEDFESGVFPPNCWFARQSVKAPSASGLVAGIDFGDEAWALAMKTDSYDEVYSHRMMSKEKDREA